MNDYYKVDFTINPADVDAADLLASNLADEGFESFEPADDGSTMTAFVPAPAYDNDAIARAVDEVPVDVCIKWNAEFVEGRDWNAEWERNYFKPIVVAGKVAVHSTFHTDVPVAEYDIVIDPRMAFGTGHHATTTLMMKALLEGNIKGANLIDMGTGTGILAILAAMLGAKKVEAIEIDPFAAENARDNVAINLGDEQAVVNIIDGDATALDTMADFADIFLANINRNIITADIKQYAAAMRKGAKITVSGFYVADRDIVANAAQAAGLSQTGVAEMDNWSSMTFVKL